MSNDWINDIYLSDYIEESNYEYTCNVCMWSGDDLKAIYIPEEDRGVFVCPMCGAEMDINEENL